MDIIHEVAQVVINAVKGAEKRFGGKNGEAKRKEAISILSLALQTVFKVPVSEEVLGKIIDGFVALLNAMGALKEDADANK
jgi:flagellar biosynthesis/type III secretory pathway ATPase